MIKILCTIALLSIINGCTQYNFPVKSTRYAKDVVSGSFVYGRLKNEGNGAEVWVRLQNLENQEYLDIKFDHMTKRKRESGRTHAIVGAKIEAGTYQFVTFIHKLSGPIIYPDSEMEELSVTSGYLPEPFSISDDEAVYIGDVLATTYAGGGNLRSCNQYTCNYWGGGITSISNNYEITTSEFKLIYPRSIQIKFKSVYK